MRQVTGLKLWIGNARDAAATSALFDHEIVAVVQLATEEPPITPPRSMIYQRFPLLDGEGNDEATLRMAVLAVAGLIQAKRPTLVGCGAGMSRSPAIAAAGWSVAMKFDASVCLKRIAEQTPVDVSPPLWRDIMQVVKYS